MNLVPRIRWERQGLTTLTLSPFHAVYYRRKWRKRFPRPHFARFRGRNLGSIAWTLDLLALRLFWSGPNKPYTPDHEERTLVERLQDVTAYACNTTPDSNDEAYVAFKWMQKATHEIERLQQEIEEQAPPPTPPTPPGA